ALDLAAPASFHHLLGRHEDFLEEVAQPLGDRLLADRLRRLLLEVRVGVNDVPALCHYRLEPEPQARKRIQLTRYWSTASTPRKNTDASATMISTMMVVITVSRRVG